MEIFSVVFRCFVHILLSLIVLACPAMGGMCCDEDRGLGESSPAEIQSCGGCCCGHEQADDTTPPAESHDHCQNCLCGGALPVGSTVADSIPSVLSVVEFAPSSVSPEYASLTRLSIRRDAESPPPYGRKMLAFHCSLLL